MADEDDRATHYRFVRADGKATPWRRVPKYGIGGPQCARARRDLGEAFNLELRRQSAPVSRLREAQA